MGGNVLIICGTEALASYEKWLTATE
jgi:hypothetical protein